MKKVNILVILFVFFFIAFNACEKDEFTEEEAIELMNELDNEEEKLSDSLSNARTMLRDSIDNALHFTVTIVNASNNSILKSTEATNGIQNIVVTAVQDGEVHTDSTNSAGMVVFQNLRLGSIALNIQGPGFTSVDLVARINQKGYYSVQVPVLSTDPANMTTINGEVKFQSDLTDKDAELVDGATVMAVVDPNSAFANALGSVSGISQVSYSDLTASATTSNGEYSIQLPADAAGTIRYKVYVEDFNFNQTVMMSTYNGQVVTGEGNQAYEIPTEFGTGVTSPSSIPSVDGVYATISAPSTNFTAATVTAIMDNFNSIGSVNVTETGMGYSSPPGSYYSVTVTDASADQEAVVKVYVNNNRVSYIEVDDGGQGYSASSSIDLSFEQEPFECVVQGVNGTGSITDYNINNGGKYITRDENATMVFTSTGGSGAVATPVWNWNAAGRYYSIDAIVFEEDGSGYAVDDEISVSLSADLTPSQAQLNLSSGSISAIEVDNPGAGYAKNVNFLVEMEGDAVARAYTDADGRIKYINVEDAGTGYASAPAVAISLFSDDIEFDVVFSDGEISGLNITNNVVHVQEPLLSFFNQSTGDEITDVSYDVSLSGTTMSVTINNPGTGYSEGNYPVNAKNPTSESTLTVTSGGSVIHNIDLGTGKRSIEQ